ncbi:DUF1573 domain-containing protein [uncultured Mucilaginibacter sp.]|uniref:DUF1573 domain-containing protein n=1 Tax=uncultured Mucilaginibacter sp. TaxID=797541 RepID=UPI0025E4DA3D|nr:DUF1573 domain-containing protein [uncultured Mucilaginibacter sp.]
MKKMLFGLLAASMLMACHQSNKSNTQTVNTLTAIKFTEIAFDFGKIKQGASVTHNFTFINSGKAPLIISDATATCGCTKPEWPKTPVNPGEQGTIKVTFNSEGKSGLQDKMITVTANTNPADNMVHLVGEVTK